MTRIRSATVPADAWWSDSDNEWVLGPKDKRGRLHGKVRYWRPNGTLVSADTSVHGKPHGLATRYHPSGDVFRVVVHLPDARLHMEYDEDGHCQHVERIAVDGTTTTLARTVAGLSADAFSEAFDERYGALDVLPDVVVSAAGGYHRFDFVDVDVDVDVDRFTELVPLPAMAATTVRWSLKEGLTTVGFSSTTTMCCAPSMNKTCTTP